MVEDGSHKTRKHKIIIIIIKEYRDKKNEEKKKDNEEEEATAVGEKLLHDMLSFRNDWRCCGEWCDNNGWFFFFFSSPFSFFCTGPD